MSEALSSYPPRLVTAPSSDAASRLTAVESRFIQNWAGLARAFGMDPLLGRLHAVVFLAAGPMQAGEVAELLGISPEQAARGLDNLVDWGVMHEVGYAERDAWRSFEAEGDPWTFFLVTLKERGRREFGPLVSAIREANAAARALRAQLPSESAPERRRLQRIHGFSEFVEQIAGLLETFASLGAGPLMSAMRMVSKVRGPRLLGL